MKNFKGQYKCYDRNKYYDIDFHSEYGPALPINFTGIAKDEDNWFYYYKDGKLHREDGPAILRFGEGSDEYRIDGKIISVPTNIKSKDFKRYIKNKNFW